MKQPTTPGVYCVKGVGDFVKIGRAKNIRARIRELQTGQPQKLSLLAVLSRQPEDEAKFHARFAHLRESGEWFRLTDEIHSAIRESRTSKSTAIAQQYFTPRCDACEAECTGKGWIWWYREPGSSASNPHVGCEECSMFRDRRYLRDLPLSWCSVGHVRWRECGLSSDHEARCVLLAKVLYDNSFSADVCDRLIVKFNVEIETLHDMLQKVLRAESAECE